MTREEFHRRDVQRLTLVWMRHVMGALRELEMSVHRVNEVDRAAAALAVLEERIGAEPKRDGGGS